MTWAQGRSAAQISDFVLDIPYYCGCILMLFVDNIPVSNKSVGTSTWTAEALV